MSVYVYLLTEGVHDVAFLGRLLQTSLKFERVSKESDLAPAWKRILPTKWPHDGSLRPSVPAPSFYRHLGSGTSAAVVNAQGIGELAKRLKTHRAALDLDGVRLDAVGVVLDADAKETPTLRFNRMADALSDTGFPHPPAAEVVVGAPRTGVFVLPGGGAQGTLEDLLLECSALVYPTLRSHAERFIDGLDRSASDFVADELKELEAPAGRRKAVVAAMGAILKPGKPIQATLEDHRWIVPHTLNLPRISALLKFLSDLTGVSIQTSPSAAGERAEAK
jgi:hypothetical protein